MIRRFFTRILMVVLIFFCGYNWLEMRALRTEVADLQAQQSVTDKKLSAPTDWRISAQPLEREIADLRSQAQSPDTRRRLTVLQKQARLLGQQADALWRRVNAASGRPAP